jgi:hypothetical protein
VFPVAGSPFRFLLLCGATDFPPPPRTDHRPPGASRPPCVARRATRAKGRSRRTAKRNARYACRCERVQWRAESAMRCPSCRLSGAGDGDEVAGGRKNVCANRRNPTCATRNRTPSAKVFFSRCSTRQGGSAQPSRTHCIVAPTGGVQDLGEKKARFTDVFFQAHVRQSNRVRPSAAWRRRHPRLPAPSGHDDQRKKS